MAQEAAKLHHEPSLMLGELLDRAMDWTVVPGYGKLGFRVRERLLWPQEPLELAGRSVMVTGANSGIGEAACVELARAGARVQMVARNRERGESARSRIVAAAGADPEQVELHLCDVSRLASVRELASDFLSSGRALHVLINNAGVLAPRRMNTEEGFELTFATNVLGPFLLTALLLPALRRRAPSRVINVSSGGMYTARIDLDDLQLERRDFDGARFYAHTKRAEVILSEEWGRRLAADEVTVHSAHPGWAATAGVESSLPRFNRVMRPLLRDAAAGADTIVWLAGSPRAARGTGAFWHDRRSRPRHRVPWTRESAEERARLFEECERLCGFPPGGATSGSQDSPSARTTR